MAATNGYTPKQSSSLYITDGDEIDWAYGRHRIFMYTFELYPSDSQVSGNARFYPPDEVIGPETERNRKAVLYLIDKAECRYEVLGKARTHCGPLFDDFEIATGWRVNRFGTDTARAGAWQRANPASTSKQLGQGSDTSGSKAVVTGVTRRYVGELDRPRSQVQRPTPRRSSRCRRGRSATSRSGTTWPTPAARVPRTTSGHTSCGRTD